VEEFRKPPPPTGIINTLKRKLASPEPPPADRFALPAIPIEWHPTSVSIQEKHLDIIEKAKQTEGLPDTDDAYFTPAQIAQMELDKAREHARNERKRAIAKIVEYTGKPYNQLTRAEILESQNELNIDPVTEQIRPDPVAVKKPAKTPGRSRKDGPRSVNIPKDTSRYRQAVRAAPSGAGSAEMSGGLGMGDTAAQASDTDGAIPPSGRTRSKSSRKRQASFSPGRAPPVKIPRRA
jgi:hypothetical protein